MSIDPAELARMGSWVATLGGLAMWLWGWLAEKNAIQKLRYRDCGMVLVFSAILVRVVTQEREWTPFDWAMLLLGPLFIGAALWRLTRTTCPPNIGER